MKRFKFLISLLLLLTFTFSTMASANSEINSSEESSKSYTFTQHVEDGKTVMIVIKEYATQLLALTNTERSLELPNGKNYTHLYGQHIHLDENLNPKETITDDMLWVVTKDTEGYVFQNKGNGKYLSATFVDSFNGNLGFTDNIEEAAHWYFDNYGALYYLNTDLENTDFPEESFVEKFTLCRLPGNQTYIGLNPVSTDEVLFFQEVDITVEPEPTTEISGVKTWIHGDNPEENRPYEIVVNLYSNGNKIESITVTEEDNWTYTFDNLPVYENGEEIIYTVDEDPIESYISSVDGYNITNTFSPEDPVDPADPEDPVDPEDPIDPQDPEDPVEPQDPVEPVTPQEPEEPQNPDTPVTPEEPTAPANPNNNEGSNSPKTGDITPLIGYSLATLLSTAGAGYLVYSSKGKKR